MLGWIVRILFILAAPIAALPVSLDAPNFGLVQTLVAIVLIVAFVGLAAAWTAGAVLKAILIQVKSRSWLFGRCVFAAVLAWIDHRTSGRQRSSVSEKPAAAAVHSVHTRRPRDSINYEGLSASGRHA